MAEGFGFPIQHSTGAAPVRRHLNAAGTVRPAQAPGDAEYWAAGTTALILLFAVVAVRVHELFPYIFRPLKPAITIAIPAAYLLFSHSSRRVIREALQYRQTRLLLAFFAFALVTVPFALWPGRAFSTARGLLPAVLLFLGCMLVRPARATLDRVQLAFVALVLFFSAYVQVFGRTWAGRLRPLGGSFDTNDMAALMALTFPLAAGLLVRSSKGRPRALAIAAVVALVLGVVATGSRGGTLALVAAALVFGLSMRGPRSIVVWTAMIAGGLLAWNRASPDFRARMMSLTNLEQDYNYTSDSGRKAVWERGRGYWKANPIAGVGAGNFIVAEGGFNAETGRTGKWSAAHNAYIQALAELGTVGGGLFIAMLVTAALSAIPLWWARQTRGRAPPQLHRPELLASLAGTASAGYFLSHAYFYPLYAVLGIIALADRVAKAEKAAATASAGPQDRAGVPMLVRRHGERGGLAMARAAHGRLRGGLGRSTSSTYP